jgi:hypothetical protein
MFLFQHKNIPIVEVVEKVSQAITEYQKLQEKGALSKQSEQTDRQ